jgi:hypothetical protein
MKGIRHFLRDFTASAVKEHLRSQIEDAEGPPELTKNEIELVRFIREQLSTDRPLRLESALAFRLARCSMTQRNSSR